MNDNKRKLSPLFFVLIGLIVSSLLGIAESQLLLDKTQQYRDNMLWKFTVVLYIFTITYTFWFYFSKKYIPFLLNMIKFIVVNLLLSLPYFLALLFWGIVSINAILTILPAQIIFLATGFTWNVANEIDPELSQNITKIGLKGLLIGIVAVFSIGLLDLPDSIVLALSSLILFGYSLLLLKRARKGLNHSQE